MKLVSRVLLLLSMYRKAIHFRTPFFRRASFVPPKQIFWKGEYVPLVFQNEEGAKWDFLSVLLEDVYGLHLFPGHLTHVLDIGANFGFFSIAARDRYPSATIHSYEPNPKLQPMIASQKVTFQFDLFCEAVGGHAGKVCMNSPDGADLNLGRVTDQEGASISKISLDEAVERMGGTVDLAKIDCEGAEWEMVQECKAWERINAITMEYHLFDGQSHQQFHESITGLGYKIVHLVYAEDCHYGHLRAVR